MQYQKVKKYSCGVIISTYNGEKYIESLLESIKSQSYKPTEIIISDDGSSDSTVSLIKNFIIDNKLNWVFYANKENNKGYYKNFIALTQNLKTDIVFFCDQDDIWYRDKIKNAMKFYEEHDDAMAVSCNIECIDENNNKIKVINYFNVHKEKKIDIKEILYTSCVLGCTLSFKRSLMEYVNIDYLDYNGGSHDTLISILAALKNGLYKANDVQLAYRIHGSNTSMKNEKNRKDRVKLHAKILSNIYECINKKAIQNKESVSYLKKMVEFENNRSLLLNHKMKKSIWFLLTSKKRYCEYANGVTRGLRMYLADFYHIMKER